MKGTLLRPTSTLSQPGSIISDGDIRRRGERRILLFVLMKFFLFSNNSIIINGISWTTSMVY
jgi:hypothetical protein